MLGLLLAPVALGHVQAVVPPAPSALDFILDWSFDPTIQLPLIMLTAAYLWAVRRVDRVHPGNPVPRAHIACFLAGMAAIEIALQSGIERYDDVLFLDHMIQHATLTMVAAPLLALGAPITLLLRVTRPEFRHGVVLPILHSRIVRAISFPIVSWLVFAGVMWGVHFSPLFDLALENDLVHDFEHVLFLGSGLLFWWQVVGLDPSPWRMPYPVRALYAGLQMPQNTFLSLAIFSADAPLYPHYATLARTWGPSPLADQQMAGAFMWVAGDMMFVMAVLFLIRAWMADEERRAPANDARVEAQEAALRAREAELAARRGLGRASTPPVSPVVPEAALAASPPAHAEGLAEPHSGSGVSR